MADIRPAIPFSRLDHPHASGTIVAYTRPSIALGHRGHQEISASKRGVLVHQVDLTSEQDLVEVISTITRAFTQHQAMSMMDEHGRPADPVSEPVCMAAAAILFKRLFAWVEQKRKGAPWLN